MRTAVLFPGQGFQRAHLGKDLYRSHQACRDVYDEAAAELGYDLIAAGERLGVLSARHDIVQPLLVAYGLAAWAAAAKCGVEPCVMAGHSLGEITALAAAGALSTTDAVRLARLRGTWMSECPDGDAWLVFGPSGDQVREACDNSPSGEVWLANRNMPDQSVVSGTAAGLEAVREPLQAIGATVKALGIGTPVHCPLGTYAADRMVQAAADTPVTAPLVPVLSTLTGERLDTADQVRGNLSATLTSCVDWVAVTSGVRAVHPDLVLECGPKTVLRDLTRSMWPGVQAYAVTDPDGVALLAGKPGCASVRDYTLRAMRLVIGTPCLDQSPEQRRRTKAAYTQLRDLLDSLDDDPSGTGAGTDRVDRLLREALLAKGLGESEVARVTGGAL
ncbi:ACP S-malonyltransferase [Streptomyces sp. NPDC018045]|uniref:ACP S-malonyltransferase n=1 Tax=Streptomyces sp. NPDC018045 TaxID=3365037 RepID=UPI0037892F61